MIAKIASVESVTPIFLISAACINRFPKYY
jgi:hypothetical protein